MVIRATAVLFIKWKNALKLRVYFVAQEVCSVHRISLALGSLEKDFRLMQNHIISSFQTTSLETKLVKIVLPYTNVYLKNWGKILIPQLSFGHTDGSEILLLN